METSSVSREKMSQATGKDSMQDKNFVMFLLFIIM